MQLSHAAPPAPPTLRDHARDGVRTEVLRQAWSLFAAQGYAATTVEQVAAAAGMSRRTFFRYFDGKDDLLLARMAETGPHLAEELADQPSHVPAWTALRAAMGVSVAVQQSHPGPTRALLAVLRDEADVRAAVEERRRRWTASLVPVLLERHDVESELAADALAGSALSCLEAAQRAWVDSPGVGLAELLDRAMAVVAGAST